jgi:ferredoxin-NADP reductase
VATPVKFRTEVARVIRHSADVATYEFRYLDRRPRYKPGQFLHLALDPYDPTSHWPESRVFTIANGASNRDFIRLTISAHGRFTRRIIDELHVGKQIWMKGPYGEFIVRTAPDYEVVLIGGGTGVTPFVAFMEDAMVGTVPDEVWLHYAARQAELLVFAELASRWAAQRPNFHLRMYAEEGARDGMISGRIPLEAVRGALKSPQTAHFYLCGPQPMIDAFAGRLRSEFGVCPERIHLDQWE